MALAPPPFQIHGLARGGAFTDRAAEVGTIVRALRTPGHKLLLLGRRRMGKSSALAAAADRAARHRTLVVAVDCMVATSLTELATLIVDASVRTLGRRWKDTLQTFVSRLTPGLTMTSNSKSGDVSVRWDVTLGDAREEQKRLEQALDALETIAAERGASVGVVLDEFQQIGRIAGEAGEWMLRGVLQRHVHVSYVLAGSELSLIERMTGRGGAFYDMLTPLPFGAIDADHFGRWIEERMRGAGLEPARGVGAECVRLAGPRTFDIVLLADHAFAAARGEAGTITIETVARAFAAVVEEQAFAWEARWSELASQQQAVLRALAAANTGLTTGATLARFGLGSSSATTRAVQALADRELVLRDSAAPTGYAFDNPYFRGWVVARALPALGIHLPVTALPSSTESAS